MPAQTFIHAQDRTVIPEIEPPGRGGTTAIKAQVPLDEMLTYASDLTSMTQGRGTYSMEYSHYEIVPQPIADKIIAAHKPSAEEE
jgi:elongation factor G